MSDQTVPLAEAEKRARKASASESDAEITRLNDEYALILADSKALVLKEETSDQGQLRARFLSVDAFKQFWSNRRVKIGDRMQSIAVAWLNHPQRRSYTGITFDPRGGPNGYYNLWRGFDAEPGPGSCDIFLDHLRVNVCREEEGLYRWVLGWFAHLVQQPWEKPGTSLVLRGAQGTGKTKVGEVIGSLFSCHYVLVDDPRYLTGRFNSHLEACLLLQTDEGFWAGDKAAEGRLKGLVTAREHLIERKGVEAFKVPNYVRLLITSNHDWVIPAGMHERRFAVLDMAETVRQDHEYFRAIDEEMANGGRAALLKLLLEFDLSAVDVLCIPKTDALQEQVISSMDPVHSWWYGRLNDGQILPDLSVWPEAIKCKDLIDAYSKSMERAGVTRRGLETEVGARLRKAVPGLIRKQLVMSEARRDWHYVLPPLEQCRASFEKAYAIEFKWDEVE